MYLEVFINILYFRRCVLAIKHENKNLQKDPFYSSTTI